MSHPNRTANNEDEILQETEANTALAMAIERAARTASLGEDLQGVPTVLHSIWLQAAPRPNPVVEARSGNEGISHERMVALAVDFGGALPSTMCRENQAFRLLRRIADERYVQWRHSGAENCQDRSLYPETSYDAREDGDLSPLSTRARLARRARQLIHHGPA